MNKNNHNNIQDTAGISQIIQKALPFWPLLAGLFFISLLSTFIYLKLAVPYYSSQASILLKDEKKGEENSKMEQDLNLLGSKNIVENQLEIIQSNGVLKKVVNKLHLMAIVQEQKGLFGMIKRPAFHTSPVNIQFKKPESVTPAEKVDFSFNQADSTVQIGDKKYPLNQWLETEWGTISFVPNPEYNEEEVGKKHKLFFTILTQGDAIGVLTENLKAVANNKNNTIVKLTYKSPVPEQGEKILEELVREYSMTNAEKKNTIAFNTLNFLDERIKKIESELGTLEGSIQRYRATTGSINMSEQSQLYLQRIEDNDRQINALALQLSALDEVEKYITSKSSNESLAPSVFSINDPVLTNLLSSLYISESKYAELKNVVAENNPTLMAVKEDIQKTKNNIIENVRSQRTSLSSNRKTLDNTNSKYSSMLYSIPKREKELVEVSRDINTKRDIYAYLLKKREEITYSMNSSFEETFFVDNPSSGPAPVSPNKKMMYLLATVIPLVLGFGAIQIREGLSGNILYRSEVEKLTKFPVIGELVMDESEAKLPAASRGKTFINEQFRYIRNTYKFTYRNNNKTDKILVTSSIQGEGKSFFATNFSISLAKAGKKVLLIEMDLHRPKLHQYFNIKSRKGMTDYLSHGAMLSEIITPIEAHPNLSVIFAGKHHENESELLTSGKIDYLLKTLDSEYNAIILDTPPIKALSDAILLAPKCNITFYLIRHNHSPKSIIQNLDKDMENYNFKNVVLVFNGVKNRGFGKYSYGHGFGYGYDFKNSYDSYVSDELNHDRHV